MLVKKVVLDENEIDYTQFCYYSLEGYKTILSYILLEKNEHGYQYSKENYKHFMEEFQQANYKYFMNTQQLLAKYAPEFRGSLNHNIIYDFGKHTMNIYYGEADEQ